MKTDGIGDLIQDGGPGGGVQPRPGKQRPTRDNGNRPRQRPAGSPCVTVHKKNERPVNHHAKRPLYPSLKKPPLNKKETGRAVTARNPSSSCMSRSALCAPDEFCE